MSFGMRRIALFLGACVALAGCGGGGSSSASKSSGVAAKHSVSISETEFKLDPSTVNIGQAGTITFKVTNNGHTTHALEIEGKGVEEETDSIQPGKSATLTVDLSKSGSYEMYCPIDGHEDKGMKGTVHVGGSAGTGGMETGGGTTTNKGPGY
jgi:uncharacterized cupredoxin-like copper-binding protein